jgi:BACON domain-containing protein
VSGDSGSGNGSVDLEFRENVTGSPRTGTINVSGHTIVVTQDAGLGDECLYSISPTFRSFSAAGGTGSISVFCEERCAWQAVSNASWISVTSASVGIGNGSVSYSVAPNSGFTARSGTINIAGKIFSIKQK